MKESLELYLISGKARHGKTTTAHMIKDYYAMQGKKSVITSFGKYIKMFAKEISDWDGSEANKPRELLQQLGTEVIRKKLGKEEFFVKRIDEDLEVYSEFVDIVIIDDVRLPLEINYFLDRYRKQTKSIHIIRPNFENDLTGSQRQHATEIGLDNYNEYDYTIMNDGGLDELREKVYSLLERDII